MNMESRVRKLEGQVHHLKTSLIVAIFVPAAAVLLMALNDPVQESIKARRITLVSESGLECAALQSSGDGYTGLTLFDRQGRTRAAIQLDASDNPSISFFTERGALSFQIPPVDYETRPVATTLRGNAHSDPENPTVYKIPSGTKYHSADCIHLASSRYPLTLEKAKAAGLVACEGCTNLK